MQILTLLIPISLVMGALGLVGFVYTLRSSQYEDPDGDSQRILTDEWDDHPKP
ncbi:cbb3-type cytochrome oxidase assembly protein CcoS [Donghicola tyrosinivorans]|uniref:Cbb3-type cytochrome oxidase maturation protein n=1 Tax=Donghicola tyrosinivorans TaxID=1652492 RepID=A0A2T0WQ03_9RHOB|nr:cbb3-type cytochrome oxidase assembly protein CcoS [Donghicola tyrosinivorans]PRY88788.1 cbb3-type cytochrome oxidase maturation protein [Donghicola tyrosinivorans]